MKPDRLEGQEEIVHVLPRRGTLVLLLGMLLLAAPATARDGGEGSRDVLWEIITTCLDTNAAEYCSRCRWPQLHSRCAAPKTCKESTEVWAETESYVALRDRKMCDCPKEFVHGLVLPRARVTGIEDPRRPDGIWSFAWDTARKRIADGLAVALVVNPASTRGQDQLHVHIVRLERDARERFAGAGVARVPKLDEVWGAARRIAVAARLDDYGVLVAAHPEGGFTVLVDRSSPEKSYAVPQCR
jgi:CDP-diacylglycerol pyrophosphatase